MQCTSRELVDALRKLLELSFGIGSEVNERHQKPADEEESIDAESSVCDGLEEELLLDDLSQLGVVWIFERDDASVTKNDPSHRERSDPVNTADSVTANVAVANCVEIRFEGEWKQKFFGEG